jgi:hypothetical protein
MTLLFGHDGRFVPINYFLKTSLMDLVLALRKADDAYRKRAERRHATLFGRLLEGIRLGKLCRRLRASVRVSHILLKHVDLRAVFGCSRIAIPGRVLKIAARALITGKSSDALAKYTALGRSMQLIVLPFEDKSTLETQRMERCRAVFAFLNPDTDEVNMVPVCAWTLYNRMMMRGIAEKYGTMEPAGAAEHASVPAE